MSLSNYERILMMKCDSCYFADKAKIAEMKERHDNEEWEKCGNVSGSCTYAFNRELIFNDDGTISCPKHKE